jgi:hypothetical protein
MRFLLGELAAGERTLGSVVEKRRECLAAAGEFVDTPIHFGDGLPICCERIGAVVTVAVPGDQAVEERS